MVEARLVNLAPAVSTEVVRWACACWGVTLKESLHVPVFHVVALAWYWTSNSSRPLVLCQGRKLRKEDEIVGFFEARVPAERRLIPDGPEGDEVRAETDFYRKTMRRAGTVRYMYYHLLQKKDLFWSSFTANTPGFEKVLASLLLPLIKLALKVGLGLNAANAVKGLDNIEEGFARAEAALADGRRYLVGDRFTMADLAFAASAAPALLLPGYGAPLPKVEDLPAHMRQVVHDLRARPAGRFAERIYAEHRHPAA